MIVHIVLPESSVSDTDEGDAVEKLINWSLEGSGYEAIISWDDVDTIEVINPDTRETVSKQIFHAVVDRISIAV